jgi:hypothetical protein
MYLHQVEVMNEEPPTTETCSISTDLANPSGAFISHLLTHSVLTLGLQLMASLVSQYLHAHILLLTAPSQLSSHLNTLH